MYFVQINWSKRFGPLNYINFQLQSEKKELTFGWLKNDDLIWQVNFDNDDVAAAEFVVVVVSGENGCGNAVVVVAEKNSWNQNITHLQNSKKCRPKQNPTKSNR